MTKKLNDLFNLDDENKLNKAVDVVKQTAEREEKVDKIDNYLQVDIKFTEMQNVQNHEEDMDNIAQESLESFRKLMDLGENADPNHAARIFESAVGMMKNAIDAKNSKVMAKLKSMEMILKKQKLDNDLGKKNDDQDEDKGIPATYAQLLDVVQQDKNK